MKIIITLLLALFVSSQAYADEDNVITLEELNRSLAEEAQVGTYQMVAPTNMGPEERWQPEVYILNTKTGEVKACWYTNAQVDCYYEKK